MLALPHPPTAIVAGVDTLAAGVLRSLRAHGRRVPGDVALVSFDEPVYADLIDPSITALVRHDRELGRRAAELLLALLSGDARARAARGPRGRRAPGARVVRVRRDRRVSHRGRVRRSSPLGFASGRQIL